MSRYYVSLTKDLVGLYLGVDADSQDTVRKYLDKEYRDIKSNVWKLPWCSIYSSISEDEEHQVIRAKCGYLSSDMFREYNV